MLDLDLDRDKATRWQRCGSCAGRNPQHATACEFCARMLGRPQTAPAKWTLHSPTRWLPILLALLLLCALIVILIEALAVK